MFSLFGKKYRVAVLDSDEWFLSKISDTLISYYSHRVIVEKFSDPARLFEAINVQKARHTPFDLAILGENEIIEEKILNRTSPDLSVVLYKNAKDLLSHTSKIFG